MPLIDNNHPLKPTKGFASDVSRAQYAPNLELEPTNIQIAVDLDIPNRTAVLVVTTDFVSRRDGARSVALDAVGFEDLQVVDVQNRSVEWRYDGNKVQVTWAEGIEAGATRSLKVSYRVHQPTAGLYFNAAQGPQTGYWAATDHETERARHWLACVDHPNVRTLVRFEITHEAGLTALANGRFVETKPASEGKETTTWVLDEIVCPSYLICMAVGRFSKFDDGEFQGRPLQYFAADYIDPADLERSFGRTGAMMAWMAKRLGVDFPFSKYFQFALPGIGGAMENISLVSWDEIFVLKPDLAQEWTWLLDQINVHEMGHAYFGDAVVCRDFAHVWLKESWATYIETCWLEDTKGEDEWKYDFFRNAHAYFDEADNAYSRPIVTRHFDSSWDMFDRHLYPGGACRLHTLRSTLGDRVFWPAVTEYLETYSGGVVETDDFRRLMEKHSGRSLAQFFDQWFKTAGYPDLKIGFSFDAEKHQSTFEIEQKNAKDGVPFVFDLDLAWWIDGKRHVQTVQVERANHEFVVECPVKPEMVRVDPDCRVLHKLEFNPGNDMLLVQLASGDVLGRILAGRELAKTGKRSDLEAIAKAYKTESFWGVRQQWAQSLASPKSATSVALLTDLVGWESDPMVLEFLMRQTGGLRDAGLAAALEKRLGSASFNFPWARQHAWRALGKQRASAPVGLLRQAAQNSGTHAIEQAGAVSGLAETRLTSELEGLMALAGTADVHHVRARTAAAQGIADLGALGSKAERERATEFLVDGLRDASQDYAKACANALISIHALSAKSAIEGFVATLPHQDQVSFEKRLGKMGDPDSRVADMKASLEALETKTRKLEERLAKLEDKS